MGKASRAKQLRDQRRATRQALLDRLQESLPHKQIKVVERRPGPKVSDMLMELAEPWLDEAENDIQRSAVVGMAVLAWNMARIPEPERWEGVSLEFAANMPEPVRAILLEMIDRKLDFFPEDTRSILDYEIAGSGNRMRVEVAYSRMPNEITDLEHGDYSPG